MAYKARGQQNSVTGNQSITGTLTVSSNVTSTTGDFILGTAGKGVQFGGAGGGTGTVASRLLDDYEEGTFTPTVVQGITTPTYTTQTGYYTKIGNVVRFWIYMQMAPAQTRNADLLIFGGLPYSANPTPQGGANIQYSAQVVAAGVPPPRIYIASANCACYKTDGTSFVGNDLANTRPEINISGVYKVAS